MNSKRVPTLVWMNALGKRVASAWVARHPLLWAGTRKSGENFERVAGRSDDRLERLPAQVKASEQGVKPIFPGERADVAQDVDDPRVPATGQDDEAVSADIRHQRLVVEYQRIGFHSPCRWR